MPNPNYHLFHQNLRTFTGGNSVRDKNFKTAMRKISGKIGVDRVLVAGFTEVMNGKSATIQSLKRMACALDPGLTAPPLMFAVGITAFKSQIPEFVALSIYQTFKVEFKGRVLPAQQLTATPNWTCYPSTDIDIGEMPDNIKPDCRGLAYVCGKYSGKKIIAGFMHNMYALGDRSSVFQMLPEMIQLIQEKHSNYASAGTFLGGDFNVRPRPITSSVYTVNACDTNGNPIKTTKNNPYDFWVCNKQIANSNAGVFVETRDPNPPSRLSDHAGIMLQVPLNTL